MIKSPFKLIRRLFKLCVFLVVLTIVVIVVAFITIDSIAEAAIEHGATYALGVETTVDDTDIGVFSGSSQMRGLNIANPENYTSPYLVNVETTSLDVSYGDLREETVHVPTLTLDAVDIHIEKRQGKSNIDVVIENLKRFESDDPASSDEDGARFVIDEIVITNVMVHTELLPLGGELTRIEVPIDEIRLTGIGADSDRGVILSQLSGVIFKAILAAIVHNGVNLPADLLADLGAGLAELQPLADLGVGVLTGAGELIGGVAQGVGGLLEGIGKGVGDLLGGKKPDDP